MQSGLQFNNSVPIIIFLIGSFISLINILTNFLHQPYLDFPV